MRYLQQIKYVCIIFYFYRQQQYMRKSQSPSPLTKNYLQHKSHMSSYKELHQTKHSKSIKSIVNYIDQEKPFYTYKNGILIGNINTKRGLFLQYNGQAVFHLKSNQNQFQQTVYSFPDGQLCYCTSTKGGSILQGWTIFYKEKSFLNIYYFRNNQLQGLQYHYEYHTKLLTKSLYKNNYLIKIVNSCKVDNKYSFIEIQNKEVNILINKIFQFNFQVDSPKVKKALIVNDLYYFGQIQKNTPNGFGIMLSAKERFQGFFRNGVLDGLGRIKFENGDICEGFFNNGECQEFCKFTHSQTSKSVYKVEQQQVSEQQYKEILQNSKIKKLDIEANYDIFPNKKILEIYDNMKRIFPQGKKSEKKKNFVTQKKERKIQTQNQIQKSQYPQKTLNTISKDQLNYLKSIKSQKNKSVTFKDIIIPSEEDMMTHKNMKLFKKQQNQDILKLQQRNYIYSQQKNPFKKSLLKKYRQIKYNKENLERQDLSDQNFPREIKLIQPKQVPLQQKNKQNQNFQSITVEEFDKKIITEECLRLSPKAINIKSLNNRKQQGLLTLKKSMKQLRGGKHLMQAVNQDKNQISNESQKLNRIFSRTKTNHKIFDNWDGKLIKINFQE